MLAPQVRQMFNRRMRVTSAVAVVLLSSATLSSCGFDAPTDRINTIAAGANNRDASVDALGIRVLATEAGAGRLIGALANNDATEAATLEKVAGEGVEAAEFEPIEIAGGGRVNLAAEDATPIFVTGEFTAGQVIELEFNFETGETETVKLDVPVVKNCNQYTAVPSAEAPGDDSASASGSASAEESSESSEGDDTFLCEHPTDDGGH